MLPSAKGLELFAEGLELVVMTNVTPTMVSLVELTMLI